MSRKVISDCGKCKRSCFKYKNYGWVWACGNRNFDYKKNQYFNNYYCKDYVEGDVAKKESDAHLMMKNVMDI